jgi:hypothetical protein
MSHITWVKDGAPFTVGKVGDLPVFEIESSEYPSPEKPFALSCELLGKIDSQFITEEKAKEYAEKRLERFMHHTGLVFGEVAA